MKIALIGYGKMGKAIESIAIERGHQIVLKIDSSNKESLTISALHEADVAIEFTNPHSAVAHLKFCFNAGIPVVCGSTGWLHQRDEVEAFCIEKKGGFLYASNFSIGVNIFFEINKMLARLMNKHPEYEVNMEEVHHTEKKDAPSGTAISLANDIINELDRKENWISGETNDSAQLSITSKRIDPAPGTHMVKYQSAIDSIEIIHTAHNRKGFALGAVLAAEFMQNKKGLYQMKDVLEIS